MAYDGNKDFETTFSLSTVPFLILPKRKNWFLFVHKFIIARAIDFQLSSIMEAIFRGIDLLPYCHLHNSQNDEFFYQT